MLRIPVLTYHSAQVDGHDYESNDHIALRSDLHAIRANGFRVVPLSWVVDWVLGERPDSDLLRAVAVTFDDGCTMDFLDMVHPTWGSQQSFFNILRDHRDRLDPEARSLVEATSFVIGSPDTRQRLGERLAGPQWISDDWWSDAIRSGILAVENHSWDHNHPVSDRVCQKEGVRGRFDNIDTFEECDSEITLASDYIEARTGTRPSVFAYPWGQYSSYIRDVYFPRFPERHRCRAAFAAHDGFITRESCIWALPRLVFRANWSNASEFHELLASTSRVGS